MDIIAKRKIFLGFSGTFVLISLVLIFSLGLRQGIDLKGGTRWELYFESAAITEELVRATLEKEGIATGLTVKKGNDGNFILRLKDISEEEHQKYLNALQRVAGEVEEKNFASIGPVVGTELRKRSLWAMVLVLLGVSVYVALAFRKVSEPIKSWKYGVVTLVTLFHDVSIPAGLLSVLGRLKGVEIDTNFIVALLVVMGFSVHDTIVVFDRIRENLILKRGTQSHLYDIINYSIKETLARSVNTSLTLIIVLLTLMFFGPAPLFYFVLTILVGTIVGTYSSIFVASPLLYLWQRRSK